MEVPEPALGQADVGVGRGDSDARDSRGAVEGRSWGAADTVPISDKPSPLGSES